MVPTCVRNARKNWDRYLPSFFAYSEVSKGNVSVSNFWAPRLGAKHMLSSPRRIPESKMETNEVPWSKGMSPTSPCSWQIMVSLPVSREHAHLHMEGAHSLSSNNTITWHVGSRVSWFYITRFKIFQEMIKSQEQVYQHLNVADKMNASDLQKLFILRTDTDTSDAIP